MHYLFFILVHNEFGCGTVKFVIFILIYLSLINCMFQKKKKKKKKKKSKCIFLLLTLKLHLNYLITQFEKQAISEPF